MPGQHDAFFTVRPDPDDLIQLDRHEDSHPANGEVHEDHLPHSPELQRVFDQRLELLSE